MATTQFDWKATESAPKNYPMKIMKGDFIFPDGDSLYVPNMKLIHHGWGNGISSHLVGPDLKSLPNRLKLLFFSYSEDKFYEGDFELPYKEILKLFQQGYYSAKVDRHVTYFEIIAGVAPGGWVSVWLGGIDRTTEVFGGQAKEVEVDWKRMIDNPNITRQEFIETAINDARKEEVRDVLSQKGVPVGLWDHYRKRYPWEPIFTGNEPPKLISRVRYFNGEDEYLLMPLNEEFKTRSHPIPKEMIFRWTLSNSKERLFELYFDEQEITSAFEKLGQADQALHLRLHTEPTEKGPGFWIVLQKADDEEDLIVLRKTKVEFHGVRPAKK